MTRAFISRLDAHDRAWLTRLALSEASTVNARRFWKGVTLAGGATFTILISVVALSLGTAEAADAGRHALATLVVSHLAVQLIKRTVGRPRPSRGTTLEAVVAEPDRFSFPSGHAAAAMSIALGLARLDPALAPALLCVAALVGFSRVALAVHYPGDVLAGQTLAMLSGFALDGL